MHGVIRLWDADDRDSGGTLDPEQECVDAPAELLSLAVHNGFIYTGDVVGCCGVYKRIAVSARGDVSEALQLVRRVDLQSGKLRALDVDSNFVFGVGSNRFISVWDVLLTKEEVLVDATAGSRLVQALTMVLRPAQHPRLPLSATTFYVAAISTSNCGLIVAWDASLRVAKGFAIAHEGCITAMTHADMHGSSVVISAGADGNVCVWDPCSLECLACLPGLEEAGSVISCLASAPQGRFLSLSSDGWLRVWNFGGGTESTPREPKVLAAH